MVEGGSNSEPSNQSQKSTKPKPTTKSKRPSEEEIEAKRKERAEKKERKEREEKENQKNVVLMGKDGKIPFTVRQWSKVKGVDEISINEKRKVKLISWNILAQGLVRRKLFPGSDCLKWKDRQLGLTSEMLSLDWDLATLQEVDRIEVHGENLKKNGKNFVYAKGYNDKQHGLMISWRVQQQQQNEGNTSPATVFEYEPVDSKVIFFDREFVDTNSNEKGKRLGLSRVTRNIALFVALRFKRDPSSSSTNHSPAGIIISTTHLFWHPMHAYERVRQMGIMKRRLQSWKEEHGKEWQDWPIFLSGDFNDQPHSATYKLVTGQPITQHCLEEVCQSTVVHQSVDELKQKIQQDQSSNSIGEAIIANGNAAQQECSGAGNEEEENEGEEGKGGIDEEEEDDQVLKNCRLAKVEDGLLSFSELVQLHDLSQAPPSSKGGTISNNSIDQKWVGYHIPTNSGLQSLYGANFNKLEIDQDENYFSSSNRWRERYDDPDWTPNSANPHLDLGSFEPMYTLFSPLFCLTLDYIFLFPSKDQTNTSFAAEAPVVTALLPTHRTDVLQPGIPRRNVCASDHIVIGAEVAI